MKQLTCEMCGGTDLIKQDGAFVCQNCGMKYSDMEKDGMLLPLTRTEANYHHGLRYEDEVLIECRISKLSVARCEFEYKVYKLPEMKLCTDGKTAHGFTDVNFKPINLKKKFPGIWDIMQKAIDEEKEEL